MKLEPIILQCKGLPYFLREIAKLLNEGALLYKIRVEKHNEYLQGTKAHSSAKRKNMIVYVERDKPANMKLQSIKEEDSGNLLNNSIVRNVAKGKS